MTRRTNKIKTDGGSPLAPHVLGALAIVLGAIGVLDLAIWMGRFFFIPSVLAIVSYVLQRKIGKTNLLGTVGLILGVAVPGLVIVWLLAIIIAGVDLLPCP